MNPVVLVKCLEVFEKLYAVASVYCAPCEINYVIKCLEALMKRSGIAISFIKGLPSDKAKKCACRSDPEMMVLRLACRTLFSSIISSPKELLPILKPFFKDCRQLFMPFEKLLEFILEYTLNWYLNTEAYNLIFLWAYARLLKPPCG